MLAIHDMTCCGVKEIRGISGLRTSRTIKAAIKRLADDLLDRCAFVIFTQARSPLASKSLTGAYGERFKEVILKEGLGEVVESEGHRNPNSGNLVKVYTWAIDQAALAKLAGVQRDEEEEG